MADTPFADWLAESDAPVEHPFTDFLSTPRPPVRAAELVAQTPATVTEPSLPAPPAGTDRASIRARKDLHDAESARLYAAEPPTAEERGPSNYPPKPITPKATLKDQLAAARANGTDMTNPGRSIEEGISQAASGIATLSAKAGRILTHPEEIGVPDPDTVNAASDVFEGSFKAGTPFVINGAIAQPVRTAIAVFKAAMASEAVKMAGEQIGTSPEVTRLASNVAAAASGLVDVRAGLKKGDIAFEELGRKAGEYLRSVKEGKPYIDVEPITPSEPPPAAETGLATRPTPPKPSGPAAPVPPAPQEPTPFTDSLEQFAQGPTIERGMGEAGTPEQDALFTRFVMQGIQPKENLNAAINTKEVRPRTQEEADRLAAEGAVPTTGPSIDEPSGQEVVPSETAVPSTMEPADVPNPRADIGGGRAPAPSGVYPEGSRALGTQSDAAKAARAELRKHARERRAEYEQALADAPAEVVDKLTATAKAHGFTGDEGALRRELASRIKLIADFDAEFEEAGENPTALLKAIASYGGISDKDLSDVDVQGVTFRGTPFGRINGVNGVRTKRGLTWDGMREALSQEPRFQHIRSINDLQEALMHAARAKPQGIPADRLEQSLGPDWWDRILPTPEEQERDAVADEDGDISFDPDDPQFAKRKEQVGPSLFDAAQGGDVLDTGEVQPRLPGAEQVRDQDIAQPEFEAPFALTSEAVQRKSVAPSLFGDEKPKFSTNDDDDEAFKDFNAFLKQQRQKQTDLAARFDRDGYLVGHYASNPNQVLVLMPSTRQGVKYQVTSFSDKEPSGHRDYQFLGTEPDAKGNHLDQALSEFMSKSVVLDDDLLFSKREEPAPVFYSALTRAAESLPQAKGTPDQMAAMLQKAKGVKKEELDWSGVVPWLQGQGRFVTKSDIVDYLKANELKVTEKTLGETGELDIEPEMAVIRAAGFNVQSDGDITDEPYLEWEGNPVEMADDGAWIDGPKPFVPRNVREAFRRVQHKDDAYTHGAPKFGQHVLPGGSNYRELLITLPQEDRFQTLVAQRDAVDADIQKATGGARFATPPPDLVKKYNDLQVKIDAMQSQQFSGGHFDEPNVLAHLRFDDRTDVDGKRVLFIEEVQSDWHQKGRKHGYKTDLKEKFDKIKAAVEAKYGMDLIDIRGGKVPWTHALAEDLRDVDSAFRAYQDEFHGQAVPDAPFKTTWPELAMKRAIRYASEHGYDSLAWTTGEQQAERYDLSKQVDAIHYTKRDNGNYDLTVWKDGHNIDNLEQSNVPLSRIEELVGKDVTARISADEGDVVERDSAKRLSERGRAIEAVQKGRSWYLRFEHGAEMGTWLSREDAEGDMRRFNERLKDTPERRLTGENLKVGGAGMKGFYDHILPTFLNKYLKPFNARVGETHVTTPPREDPDQGMVYEGPTLTYAQVAEIIRTHPNAGGFNRLPLSQIIHAMRQGEQFETAMHAFGTMATARMMGGRFRDEARTVKVHAVDLTDPMRTSVMEGQPLFAKQDGDLTAQAREQWGLLKDTYESKMQTVQMGDRAVAVLDAGSRLTPDELKRITENPDVQAVAEASLKVLDEVLDHVIGSTLKTGVERTGLIFDDRTYGVYVPKPGESHGPQKKAAILLNLFEAMLPSQTPAQAAKTMVLTAAHEALHWHIAMDGPEFEDALLRLMDSLGAKYVADAAGRIMRAYADVDNQARYRPGLRDLLSLYAESRRRSEVAPDSISRSGRRQTGPPDVTRSGNKPPPYLRSGRERTVTQAQLEALAKKHGTSVAVQRDRAEKAGYRILTLPAPGPAKGGPTLQATVIPGAAEFGEHVLEPAVQKIAEAVRNDRNLILGVLSPARVGVAPLAAGKVRAHNSANDQRKARVIQTLDAIKKKMDGWSQEQSLQFADVMEGQQPLSVLPNDWQGVAEMFRKTLTDWRTTLLKHDLLENYLANYWPHEWKQESLEGKTLRKLFGRRPMQGPESYRKKRSIPTVREGIAFGLEPATWNPAEQLQRKVFEMSQSVKGRDLHHDLVKSGVYAYVPATKPKPEAIRDWQRVPEYALGTKYGPSPKEGPPGRLVMGHYYAPPEVVRLIENHLSPGLWGKSVAYDLYKAAGNISTQLLLGWSTFHMWLTGLESVISKASLAMELASRGEFTEAAKKAAQVGPQGVVRDLMRGYRAVQEFYARDADANDTTGIIGQIVQGGGGLGWSLFEHEDAPAKFMTNVRQVLGAISRGDVKTVGKKAVPLVFHGAMAAYELPTTAIMNHWVPYLKVSAFLDMAEMELRRAGPETTLDEQRKILGDAWDAVDDRFGQLRYENLFWNNSFKQLLTGGFLSVGWNVGSLRHGLGVLGQIPRLGQNLKALAAGGGGRPPGPPGMRAREDWFRPEGEPTGKRVVQPWLHRNAAWLFSMAVLVGTAGAIYQYLRSGKKIGEKTDGGFDAEMALRDLFNPRNGKVDGTGREERDTPISYMKDYYGWTHHPITTLEHKAKPFLSMLYEAVTNEDFYGDAVRNPDDPAMQQLEDTLSAWIKRSGPIAWENAGRRAGDGAPMAERLKAWAAIQAVPFTPSSAEIERSDLENYLHGLIPPSHRTKEEAEKAVTRRQFRSDLEAKKPDAIAKARTAGMSPQSITATLRSERLGSLKSAYQRTTWGQAVRGYTLGTPDERAMLRPLLLNKVGPALANAGSAEARKKVLADRTELMRLPYGQAEKTGS